jgi:hypothetical protein
MTVPPDEPISRPADFVEWLAKEPTALVPRWVAAALMRGDTDPFALPVSGVSRRFVIELVYKKSAATPSVQREITASIGDLYLRNSRSAALSPWFPALLALVPLTSSTDTFDIMWRDVMDRYFVDKPALDEAAPDSDLQCLAIQALFGIGLGGIRANEAIRARRVKALIDVAKQFLADKRYTASCLRGLQTLPEGLDYILTSLPAIIPTVATTHRYAAEALAEALANADRSSVVIATSVSVRALSDSDRDLDCLLTCMSLADILFAGAGSPEETVRTRGIAAGLIRHRTKEFAVLPSSSLADRRAIAAVQRRATSPHHLARECRRFGRMTNPEAVEALMLAGARPDPLAPTRTRARRIQRKD